METREEQVRNFVAERITYKDSRVVTMLKEAAVLGMTWADAHPQNPWISVEERLPEIGREVYLYHYGYFEIARRVVCKDRIYNRDGTYSDTIEWKINHGISYSDISKGDYWMPIPELKKGE